ncbi:uncharacterized protein E0L32_008468 [Thyridium curvatum]|uniref:Cytochrome b-c1 complex subunit 2, mitochondrial n=1 Tax=Thyridium curvatum TaxID=1093900 RepID=A0A507ALI9_9PEZI|nr:uncharacterized protein E0L32_008468 [Thyridium curvatum]TPX10582.1 hypothetical protein E0L32_008468 [Thyridium curvatum]
MISRSAVTRGTQLALRRQGCAFAQRRGYAAAAAIGSESGSYEPTDIAGIKVAHKDAHGPTTKLAVVAKAGTRYQPLPGLTIGLEEFAFKNTQKRSALRINRESELLGGQLNAFHTREALVLEASFLKEDLPYFTELLGEVLTQTKYTTHEFHENVENIIHLKQDKLAHDASAQALDAAHAVAFHSGLGAPLYPLANSALGSYLSEHSVAAFAEAAYVKPNIALVADGASQSALAKWVEPLFKGVASSSTSQLSLNTAASKYYGGEQRVANGSGNSMVIAFPGAALGASKPETAVLKALLGGQSSIKWSPGFTLLAKAAAAAPGASVSASNFAYSDAGLFAIQISGSACAVRKCAEEAVKAVKSVAEGGVSKEDLTKAIAKAKFDALTAQELSGAGLVAAGTSIIHGAQPFKPAEAVKSFDGVTADKVKAAAKALLDGKASVATVGDLYALPYAEELGLKV